MRKLFFVLFALMVNMFMGSTLAAAVGVPPVVGGVVLNGVQF